MAAPIANLVQPRRLDEEDVFAFVRASLGGDVVDLEVTNNQLSIFLQNSLDKYSRMIPSIEWFSLLGEPNVQEYYPPADTIGYGIINVYIPRLDPIAPLLLSSGPRLDIFGYRYSYPYRDISELTIDYYYFSEAVKILSASFDWEYFNGCLHVHPKPDEPFTLTYASAFPRSLRNMRADDMDWIKSHVLAQAKRALGYARRKFSIPGSQTGQPMDGGALVAEAAQELAVLEQDLLMRTPPYPILREL